MLDLAIRDTTGIVPANDVRVLGGTVCHPDQTLDQPSKPLQLRLRLDQLHGLGPYHRMRRAISYVNSGKFRVKTEAEQQIWNKCSRLIANAIIYYNTLILSRIYEQKLAAGDEEAIKILRKTSPIAWRNVNLFGNFDFTAGASPVDIAAGAARFNNPNFWRRSMQESDDDGLE